MSQVNNNKKQLNVNKYNSEFLQCFWDLANEQQSVRISAGKSLLFHLYKRNNDNNDTDTDSTKPSVEYALNRLVRGLASSREAARQGFALCLCEMFRLDNTIGALGTSDICHKALEILDSNTKISGSMKGSEERDNMFGKLFCYLSILKSQRINSDEQLAVNIFDRIIELHNRKGWIREVTTDAILLFIAAVNIDIVKLISPKLSLLLNESISEMSAWQIMLHIGLQNIENKDVRKYIKKEILSSKDAVSMDSLNDISLTLLAATAGFPKLHRVWDFILSFVFPLDSDRFLQTNRLKSFSTGQEESLTKLIQYIEKYMISGITASKEKRSVAMSLALVIVKLCPPDFIPVALSKTIVKSIYSSRVNKKHALNNLAGIIINDLVSAVGADTQCRLALASAFVQFGGANFDSNTNTKAVSTLLEGLHEEVIISHVKFLCSVIGNFNQVKLSIEEKNENSNEQEDSESVIEDDSYLLSVTSAIEALSAIGKNSKISGRGTVCAIIIGVFVRLSCFEDGTTKDSVTTKKGKKKNKAESDDSSLPFLQTVVECVRIVEESTSADKFPRSEVANLAAVKLLSLLSDIGIDTFEYLDSKSSGKEENTSNNVFENSILHFTLSFLKFLINSGLTIIYKDDQHSDNESMKVEVLGVIESINTADFLPLKQNSDAKNINGVHRLGSLMKELISHSLIHTLATEGFDIEAIIDLKNYTPLLISEVLKSTSTSSQESNEIDEDEEEESSVLKLFETCMDFMSLASDFSIKSIRDSIKKVWNSLSSLLGDNLNHEVIDAIISAVVGDDSVETDQEKNQDEENNIDSDDDSDNGDDDNQEKIENKTNFEKVDNDDEDEKDIFLNEEEAMDFLGDSDKDSDDNAIGMLQHSVEHDEAFAHMIEMRKQHRKQGLLQAKRNEMLIRSRAIDILEIILNRLDSGDSLFPMFLPLLQCLSKANSSSIIQNISEGKSYVQRLQSIIQKLCKKKFQIRSEGDESSNNEIFEEYQLVNSLLKKLISSTFPNMRHISQTCFLSLARVIISSDCSEAQQLLTETVKEFFNILCSKKNSRIVPKLFEELLINRFSDFFIPVLFNDVVEGICTAKSQFIKSELSKMVMQVLKKLKSLAVPSKELVTTSLSTMLESLTKALKLSVESSDGNSNTFKLSAKRAKPILQTIKMIIDSLNDEEIMSKNKKSNLVATLNELSQLLTDNSKSASPVIEKLVENILTDIKSLIVKASIVSNNSDNSKSSTKNSKNKNKQVENAGKRTGTSIENDSKVKNKKNKLN